MTIDDDQSGEDSLSGPAKEALLAYLRHKEATGNADVGEFLRQAPQYAPYRDIIQSHADAAAPFEMPDAPPETVSAGGARGGDAETTAGPPNAAAGSAAPKEAAFTTLIRGVEWYAQGGLGVVCRGEDAHLKRDVAVKFIRPEREQDAAARSSFQLEAEITSRLDHPGVVPVYGIGETDGGQRFYVMRFMPGESLRDQIKDYYEDTGRTAGERQVMFRNMLSRFTSVCKTIAYAHTRGILHRDIKPQNIVLGSYGETIVVDWGLAIPIQPAREHRVDGETTLIPESGGSSEHHGAMAGTLAYMPPEQAAGEALTPAADIYALGATLYHLICGQSPLQGEEQDAPVQRIIRGDFAQPSEVREDVSPALEAICRKAMALETQDRYTTALELAEDVERYLADEPVSVLPDNLPRRAARWARHHPVAVQVGAVSGLLVLLSVAAGAIISWIWYGEAVRMKETTLLRSSELAAVRWSTDLALRWRILRHWADDPELHEGLQKLAAMDKAQLQDATEGVQWLEDHVEQDFDSLQVTSWYLNDARGRLVARYPRTDAAGELLGKRFDYRSYFHGGPDDLPDDGSSYEPLTAPHLSAVYLSLGEDGYKVALSVPIRAAAKNRVAGKNPEGEQKEKTIGVLTMTINLGLLKDADLIDMRANSFGGKSAPRKGIYLNQITSRNTDPRSLARATDAVIRTIEAQNFGQAERARGVLIPDYTSPLDPPGTPPRPAAIAPVLVDGEWTGLVVVVQQAANAP